MSARKVRQLSLGLPVVKAKGRGGRRKGAGRKPGRAGTWMKHQTRPWHDASHPVHVTLRVRRGVPSLRGYKLARSITEGLRRASTAGWARQVARRRTFRVVHFSIQSNHLHLIVEATSKAALARGMQGLASGLARRINGRLGRKGALFADRYHGHALATPTEARNAIVYVLKNFEKHRERGPSDGIDPCSSARWFGGWTVPVNAAETAPVAAPTTWLLRVGWRRQGKSVDRHERPASSRQ